MLTFIYIKEYLLFASCEFYVTQELIIYINYVFKYFIKVLDLRSFINI